MNDEVARILPRFTGDKGSPEREASVARWRKCRREAEHREAVRKQIEAERDAPMVRKILDRAREIEAAGLQVPRGEIGRKIAFLAASLELGQHVAVDVEARPRFERILIDHEALSPDANDVSWWHALDGHTFNLDDAAARCSCGGTVGSVVTAVNLLRKARSLYDAGFGEADSWPAASVPAAKPAAPPARWGRT